LNGSVCFAEKVTYILSATL